MMAERGVAREGVTIVLEEDRAKDGSDRARREAEARSFVFSEKHLIHKITCERDERKMRER